MTWLRWWMRSRWSLLRSRHDHVGAGARRRVRGRPRRRRARRGPARRLAGGDHRDQRPVAVHPPRRQRRRARARAAARLWRGLRAGRGRSPGGAPRHGGGGSPDHPLRRRVGPREGVEARAADPAARGRGLRRGLEGKLNTGYLGLGSNVGDRLANLRAARDALARHGVEVLASSSVYETAPQGEVTDQPDFLNACIEIRTDLEPEALLDVCKEVERELGRAQGGVRHGPRSIDIDVLLLDELEHRSDRLTLPHAEVATRRFVLEPLLELDPALRLPDGTRLEELLPAVLDQRVTPHAGGSRRR